MATGMDTLLILEGLDLKKTSRVPFKPVGMRNQNFPGIFTYVFEVEDKKKKGGVELLTSRYGLHIWFFQNLPFYRLFPLLMSLYSIVTFSFLSPHFSTHRTRIMVCSPKWSRLRWLKFLSLVLDSWIYLCCMLMWDRLVKAHLLVSFFSR